MKESADEIAKLRAKNERLRETNEMMLTDIRRTDVDMMAFKAEIERLKAEVARKDAALEKIKARRYQNRETVTPENAFEAFGRLNAEIVAIYAECDAAITGQETGR
jgi:chromosome segregation ATPase